MGSTQNASNRTQISRCLCLALSRLILYKFNARTIFPAKTVTLQTGFWPVGLYSHTSCKWCSRDMKILEGSSEKGAKSLWIWGLPSNNLIIMWMHTHTGWAFIISSMLLFLHISWCKIKGQGNVSGSAGLQKILETWKLLQNTKCSYWHYILNLKGIKENEL